LFLRTVCIFRADVTMLFYIKIKKHCHFSPEDADSLFLRTVPIFNPVVVMFFYKQKIKSIAT
jgi:hypothetical protein